MKKPKKIESHGLYNYSTGEIEPLQTSDDSNYNVRRLNMKIWTEGMDFVMESVCKSSKDIELFNHIKKMAGSQNDIILSPTQLAKEHNVSKQKVTQFIKSLIDIGFIAREAPGVYRLNPFVMLSHKAWSVGGTKTAQYLQNTWSREYGEPPHSENLKNITTLRTW